MNKLVLSLILTTLIILSGSGIKLSGQNVRLIGTDICSDGYNSSTLLTLTNTNPDKIYALFRDGQHLSARQYNPGTASAALDLGEYSEPGVYIVVEFEQSAFNQKHDPQQGSKVPGQVTISREPEIFIRKQDKEREIASGALFNYTPEADMDDVDFYWEASVTRGELTDFEKEGSGDISLTPKLAGADPAEIMFSVTPVAPDYKGGCTGRTIQLKVKVIAPEQPE